MDLTHTTDLINSTDLIGNSTILLRQLSIPAKVYGITDTFYQNLHESVSTIWVLMAFSAAMTNVINIRAFTAMGVTDGVSTSFLALALSDFFFSIFSCMSCASKLMARIEIVTGVIFPVSPFALIIYFYDFALGFHPITGMSTAYMAVARCMCVVMPLHFRNVFTKSRSIVIHVIFAVFSITSYGAIFTQMSIGEAYDPTINRTRPMLIFTEKREEVKDTVFFMFDYGVATTTQIVMTICVIIMAGSLKKAQKFRQSAQVSNQDENSKTGNKLSGKELLVIKQVVLICIVYTVCSLPRMVISVLSFAIPEFATGKELSDHYYYSFLVRSAFELINAGTTIFIYLVFNTRFRAQLLKKKGNKK